MNLVAETLEKIRASRPYSTRYRLIIGSNGKLLRVDTQIADKAMKHAMESDARREALRNSVKP